MKITIKKLAANKFDVVQRTISGTPWFHSVQEGYWETREAAESWARQHAGKRACEITHE